MSAGTGGACFTPRLNPRPKYPSPMRIIKKTVLEIVRVGTLCTVVAMLVYPKYLAFVNWLTQQGYSEQMAVVIMFLSVHTGCYVIINGTFFLCEQNGWLEEYKFIRKKYQKPTVELMKKTIWEQVINQLIAGPIFGFYVFYHVFKFFGMPRLDAPLPTVPRLWAAFVFSKLFNDVGFYWSHRMVHHPKLYGMIHKQHHTYTGSIGIAAEYAGFVESIVSNLIPSIGGCMFFGCWGSFLIMLVWIAERLWQTYETHSGYCFYGTWAHSIGLTSIETAAYHDFHHSGNRGNFGAPWLDYLCGTMDAYCQLGLLEGYMEKNLPKRSTGLKKE